MIAQSEIRMSPKPWSMVESCIEAMNAIGRIHRDVSPELKADAAQCATTIRVLFEVLDKACAAAGVSDPIALVEEIERLRNVPMAELTPAPRRSWLMRLLFGG